MITETAPAKLNLYLHVGPVRADGLHALTSLFVFTEEGDMLSVAPAKEISLSVTGPFAGALKDLAPEDNLVWKAAQLLRQEFEINDGAAIALEKNLPIAAGVGGGSADAAAAMRALVKLWRLNIDSPALGALAFRLGADIPACLKRAPVNVVGAGEDLSPGPVLPPLWACLVNPRVEMATRSVFKDFDAANPSPATPQATTIGGVSYSGLARFIVNTRNDLEPFAIARAPAIKNVIDFLQDRPGALAARMSGSGATCFALFASEATAMRSAAAASAQGWWAMASKIAAS